MKVEQLVDAIANLHEADALQCKLGLDEWKILAHYLAVRFLRAGEPLMDVGDTERELYFLGEGELVVSINGNQLATLGPGTVVGEGAFFSGAARSATVTPSMPGVAWALSWDKFMALSNKHPRLAVDLVTALAAVLAIRMRAALLVGHFA